MRNADTFTPRARILNLLLSSSKVAALLRVLGSRGRGHVVVCVFVFNRFSAVHQRIIIITPYFSFFRIEIIAL